MTKIKVLRPVLFAAALGWLAGMCAITTVAEAKSGATYVGNLGGLSEVPLPGFEAVYARGGKLPTGFSSIYIAPVGVISGQDKTLDAMEPSDRKLMQSYLYEQLDNQFGRKFRLASRPGPGVLVVNAAFTALQANKPTMSDFTRQPGLDYTRSFGIGRAGIQVDVRDGGSGDLLAAFVDHNEGLPISSNPNIHTQWGDAEQFSRGWAAALAQTLGG